MMVIPIFECKFLPTALRDHLPRMLGAWKATGLRVTAIPETYAPNKEPAQWS
jgi:hypothetical protein